MPREDTPERQRDRGERRGARNIPALDLAAVTGSLVHEIKNPLSTLSINAQLLLEDWKDASGPREARTLRRLRVMASEVERLERIIQSFLRFAEGHELNRRPGSLNRCLEDLADFIASDAQKRNLEVRLGLDPDLPQFLFDADLVRQLFLNLILNAENAMEAQGGGELILRTRRATEDGREWAVGEVIDTGSGISPRALTRIFDLYYSTTKGGQGLGLATSRRIAQEHGGFIRVQSEEGKGSQFSVFLPLVTDRSNPSREKEEAGSL